MCPLSEIFASATGKQENRVSLTIKYTASLSWVSQSSLLLLIVSQVGGSRKSNTPKLQTFNQKNSFQKIFHQKLFTNKFSPGIFHQTFPTNKFAQKFSNKIFDQYQFSTCHSLTIWVSHSHSLLFLFRCHLTYGLAAIHITNPTAACVLERTNIASTEVWF